MWSFAEGTGSDMLKTQNELIELFEISAAEGKIILEMTGEDVAGFCDEFLRDTRKWTDNIRKKLNSDMNNKLGVKKDQAIVIQVEEKKHGEKTEIL